MDATASTSQAQSSSEQLDMKVLQKRGHVFEDKGKQGWRISIVQKGGNTTKHK
jgi:hypothetical protein